eukprot:TRINITY_DN1827_c0_g1_i7.p1 TRINITY_DN1827_c0_g1~~TRINITY_DN1827_c0_g1_i7.p1  ORF type:complete len:1253 (+),score=358.99 TRINITY_DN1827_c0_g1_i7:110-3868(+)
MCIRDSTMAKHLSMMLAAQPTLPIIESAHLSPFLSPAHSPLCSPRASPLRRPLQCVGVSPNQELLDDNALLASRVHEDATIQACLQGQLLHGHQRACMLEHALARQCSQRDELLMTLDSSARQLHEAEEGLLAKDNAARMLDEIVVRESSANQCLLAKNAQLQAALMESEAARHSTQAVLNGPQVAQLRLGHVYRALSMNWQHERARSWVHSVQGACKQQREMQERRNGFSQQLELIAQRTRLQRELAGSMERCDALCATTSAQEAAHAALEEQRDHVQAELDASEARLDELEHSSKRRLQEELSSHNDEKDALEAHCAQLGHDKTSLELQLQLATESLQLCQGRCEELLVSSEECSKRLEAVIQEKGLMASQLQQQKEALCQENEELRSSSAKLQYAGVARQAADRALLRETSKQTEGLKMALEEAGARVIQVKSDGMKAAEMMQREHFEQKRYLEIIVSEVQDANQVSRAQLDSAQENFRKLSLVSISQRVADTAAASRLAKELEFVRNQLEESEAQRECLQHSSEERLQALLSSHRDEQELLELQNAELYADRTQLVQELELARQQCQQLAHTTLANQAANAALSKQLDSMLEQLNAVKSARDEDGRRSCERLQIVVRTHDDEKQLLHSQHAELVRDKANLQQQLTETQDAARDNLESALEEHRQERGLLKAEHQELQSRLEKLIESQRQCQRLTTRAVGSEAANVALGKQLEEAHEQTRRLEAHRLAVTHDNAKLQQQLNSVQQHAHAMQWRLGDEKQELETQLQQLAQDLAMSMSRGQQLVAQLQRSTNHESELESALEHSDSRGMLVLAASRLQGARLGNLLASASLRDSARKWLLTVHRQAANTHSRELVTLKSSYNWLQAEMQRFQSEAQSLHLSYKSSLEQLEQAKFQLAMQEASYLQHEAHVNATIQESLLSSDTQASTPTTEQGAMDLTPRQVAKHLQPRRYFLRWLKHTRAKRGFREQLLEKYIVLAAPDSQGVPDTTPTAPPEARQTTTGPDDDEHGIDAAAQSPPSTTAAEKTEDQETQDPTITFEEDPAGFEIVEIERCCEQMHADTISFTEFLARVSPLLQPETFFSSDDEHESSEAEPPEGPDSASEGLESSRDQEEAERLKLMLIQVLHRLAGVEIGGMTVQMKAGAKSHPKLHPRVADWTLLLSSISEIAGCRPCDVVNMPLNLCDIDHGLRKMPAWVGEGMSCLQLVQTDLKPECKVVSGDTMLHVATRACNMLAVRTIFSRCSPGIAPLTV